MSRHIPSKRGGGLSVGFLADNVLSRNNELRRSDLEAKARLSESHIDTCDTPAQHRFPYAFYSDYSPHCVGRLINSTRRGLVDASPLMTKSMGTGFGGDATRREIDSLGDASVTRLIASNYFPRISPI